MRDRPLPIGALLREWRRRRRLSQLALACEAGISTRHLSFVETGRAVPSRGMVLHLAGQLAIPVRDRNLLLAAAGYAPVFPERPLTDPALASARAAIELVLERQKPYPAFALDRHWCVVAGNAALPELYEGVAPDLLTPPVNVLRLSLHPRGLAPRIANLAEWRAHLLFRLRRQAEATADAGLIALLGEASLYPAPDLAPSGPPAAADTIAPEIAVPLRIRVKDAVLSFFSMTATFGTPLDVALSELALELFFPADPATEAAVRRMAGAAALPPG